MGDAEEITLTKENFDDLFSSSAQWEEDITAQYLRENAYKVYSFSSDYEFYYIIRTRSGELYSLNGSIYREGDKVTKTLLRGYRLADVTPYPGSLGGYIDHAFYDIDNDGEEETCVLSYGPTSGLYTFMFTGRMIITSTTQYSVRSSAIFAIPPIRRAEEPFIPTTNLSVRTAGLS